MKIRFISEDEITIDLTPDELGLIESTVVDCHQRWRAGREDTKLAKLVRQLDAVQVLLNAHTEGIPG